MCGGSFFFCATGLGTVRQLDAGVSEPGGAGGRGNPDFGRAFNPFSTKGATLSPHSTMCPPRFSDLATALYSGRKLLSNTVWRS